MAEIKANKTYVLNPCYHLRNDIHRIALFSKSGGNESSSSDWATFIHPLQAAMLSFFTHNRRLDNNLRLLADYFSRDTTYIEKVVNSYIGNNKPVYTIWRGQKIYFPKNILIDMDSIKEKYHFSNLALKSFSCREIDLTSKRLYSGPLLLTFMLNNRCMTRCTYCYADTKTPVRYPLSTPRIMELIQEAANLQVQQVNLIGGEIFLHPDWEIILKELVRLDIAPEYISTKVPFTNELLIKLKDTGYRNLIQVSLDTCDNNTLQKMLGVRETYTHEILKGLKALDQSGLPYQVSSVLTATNSNKKNWVNLYQFLSILEHLSNWRIVPVNTPVNAEPKEFIRQKPQKSIVEEVFNYMEEFILPTSKFPIILGREVIENNFYADEGGSAQFRGAVCSALNTHMFILPDGKVTICEQLYWNPRFIVGDVTHESLIEVWNSPQSLYLSNLRQQDIQEKSNCKRCTLFTQCYGARNRCWSNIIKAYGDKQWDYPDPRCCFAPEIKNDIKY